MKDIPNEDSVLRYCKPQWLHNNQPQEAAFYLRENMDENYVSAQWLEFFGMNSEYENYFAAYKDLAKRHKNLHPKGIFALLNVDETLSIFSTYSLLIRIQQIEEEKAHAGIFYKMGSLLAAHLLAQSVKKTYPIPSK